MAFYSTPSSYLITAFVAVFCVNVESEKCKYSEFLYRCPTFESIDTLPKDLSDIAVKVQTENLEELEEVKDGKNISYLGIFDSISQIKPKAFKKMVALHYLEIQNNVIRVIGPDVFSDGDLESLVLRNNKIRRIQPGAFSNCKIRHLDIMRNKLTVIEKNVFTARPIDSIYLNENRIRSIKIDAFAEMPTLYKLNLNSNFLTYFKAEDILSNSCNLWMLSLQYNNLSAIYKDTFVGIPKLNFLALSFNQIETIEPAAFEKNPLLDAILLENNKIKRLTSNMLPLTGLKKLRILFIMNNHITFLKFNFLSLLPNLEEFLFEGNPWQCGCFNLMLKWRKIHLKIDYSYNYKYYDCVNKPCCVIGSKGISVCDYDISVPEESALVEQFRKLNPI